eukprot:scaffold149_cov315-Pinguiococcus_pyrenoidosus.AAC.5
MYRKISTNCIARKEQPQSGHVELRDGLVLGPGRLGQNAHDDIAEPLNVCHRQHAAHVQDGVAQNGLGREWDGHHAADQQGRERCHGLPAVSSLLAPCQLRCPNVPEGNERNLQGDGNVELHLPAENDSANRLVHVHRIAQEVGIPGEERIGKVPCELVLSLGRTVLEQGSRRLLVRLVGSALDAPEGRDGFSFSLEAHFAPRRIRCSQLIRRQSQDLGGLAALLHAVKSFNLLGVGLLRGSDVGLSDLLSLDDGAEQHLEELGAAKVAHDGEIQLRNGHHQHHQGRRGRDLP